MVNQRPEREREFDFTDEHFRFIRDLVGERTGIVLSEAKKDMAYSRLVRRLRQLSLPGFDQYIDFLKDESSDELVNFVNAITTNLTSFFRENHHFTHLRDELLPALIEQKGLNKRLRIWSAGCSTGEEPYSIAMTVREVLPEHSGWDVKILATDLDTNVVQTASQGIYSVDRVKGLPQSVLKRWFLRGKAGKSEMVRVRPELQRMISFKELNLLNEWPFRGPFDLMFCRNVVIYFNKDTQRVLFDRYANVLAPNGHLYIGHSESLARVSERFQLIGNTIYRKLA